MEVACDVACKALDMDGECDDNDNCVCKATPEFCNPLDCYESCLSDPRAIGCILVVPDWCVSYGPFKFCGCICYRYGRGGYLGQNYNVTKFVNDI